MYSHPGDGHHSFQPWCVNGGQVGSWSKRSVTFQVAHPKPGINVKRKFARIVQMSLAFCTPMTTKNTCCQNWTVFASTNGMIVALKRIIAVVKGFPACIERFWGTVRIPPVIYTSLFGKASRKARIVGIPLANYTCRVQETSGKHGKAGKSK